MSQQYVRGGQSVLSAATSTANTSVPVVLLHSTIELWLAAHATPIVRAHKRECALYLFHREKKRVSTRERERARERVGEGERATLLTRHMYQCKGVRPWREEEEAAACKEAAGSS